MMTGPTAQASARYWRLALLWAIGTAILQAMFSALGWPWDALLPWVVCAPAFWLICEAARSKVFSGYPMHPKTALVDAPLVTDGSCTVRGVRCPLNETGRMRFGAGPSMLLLAHGAALLLGSDTAEPRERAVLEGLRAMKVDRRLAAEHSPQTGAYEAHGLVWRSFKDGQQERAYAMAPVRVLAPVCHAVWNGDAMPFEEPDRTGLLRACASESIEPLGIAMADMTDGEPGAPIFLGAFTFSPVLLPHAEAEMKRLRALGLNVALTGLNESALSELAHLLGCATICPDRTPLILTARPRGTGAELPINPGTKRFGHEAALFIHMRRKLYILPMMLGIILTAIMLCCVLAGLPGLTVGLAATLLAGMTLPAMLYPTPQPPRPLIRTPILLIVLAVSLLPMLAAAVLCALFFRTYALGSPGDLLLTAFPMLLALGYTDLRFASRIRLSAAALITALAGAAGIAASLMLGGTPLSMLFSLLAGALATLAALPVWLILRRR